MKRTYSSLDLSAGKQVSAPHPADDAQASGLAFCRAAISRALPQYMVADEIAPVRTIGIGEGTALKISFWNSTVSEVRQPSDPAFVGLSLRTTEAKAWCDALPSGTISMLPFEGAQWRFEQPLSFVQYYLPFHLLVDVCDTLFDLDLTQADMRMSADVLNTRLQRCLNGIKDTVAWIEPTNLLLDSWALILSETLLRRLSSHSEHQARMSYGRITGRRIADVVDYIEVGIDQDLRLQALADVAVMSVHHFAHSFKETVGISPHAYVLERRISRARAMLGRGSDQLAYIALACGFSSQAHLTTAFRYRLGVTPANYRRSL